MLHLEKRVLTLPEAVCSVLSGDVVPTVYDVGVTAAGPDTIWKPGARTVVYKLKKKKRKSPLAPVSTPLVSIRASFTKPKSVMLTEWIESHMYNSRGVMACIPEHATVAISTEVACGKPDYWLTNFVGNPDIFNAAKTRRTCSKNRLVFEANMLSDGVPSFLPEGDTFGLKPAETDEFFDAGITVTLRKQPYGCNQEPVKFESETKRISLCATEMAYTMEMVERGLSPCLIASFFTHIADIEHSQMDFGSTPLAAFPSTKEHFGGDVTAIVSVTQISTFSLADLMSAINKAPVKSKQSHLVGVLHGVCGQVFSSIREMTKIHQGRAMVKLNMTPDSFVFCPKLVANNDRWDLKGMGFMPTSQDYLDGIPKMTDFNAVFTTRVRGESYSSETSYVMHCMLLVAFTRAMYGAFVSSVLWKHLLSNDDPSGFVKNAKAAQSKTTNAGAFLAVLAANPEMRENPELAKALAEIVSDVDEVVRRGVVSADGMLSMPPTRSMFGKLVAIVSGSSFSDTKLFEHASESDDSEQIHLRALDEVKAMRFTLTKQ